MRKGKELCEGFFFLMIRRPTRTTQGRSSAASDVYKRQDTDRCRHQSREQRGPLINGRGQVIGINTVKASAEGLGFAIPINITKPITRKLIETGKFIPTYMGITPLDSEMLGYYATNIEIQKGLYLYNVMKGTPAASAGLKAGDVITHINGTEVNTLIKFKSLLYSLNPGDTISVRYLRNNAENTVDMELAEMPEEYR